VNDTSHRCAVRETVADKMRAVPASKRRASFRVDSCVRMVPSFGRVAVVPVQRIGSAESRGHGTPEFLHALDPHDNGGH